MKFFFFFLWGFVLFWTYMVSVFQQKLLYSTTVSFTMYMLCLGVHMHSVTSKTVIKITNQMFVWHKYPLKKRLKNRSWTLRRALSGNHPWYKKNCFKLALPMLQEKSAKCTALCYLLPFQNRCLLWRPHLPQLHTLLFLMILTYLLIDLMERTRYVL